VDRLDDHLAGHAAEFGVDPGTVGRVLLGGVDVTGQHCRLLGVQAFFHQGAAVADNVPARLALADQVAGIDFRSCPIGKAQD